VKAMVCPHSYVRWLLLFAFVPGCLSSPTAFGQGFAAIASPPRFELRTKAGGVVRSILEISNMAQGSASFNIKTADWSFDKNFSLDFKDTLSPDSCRPWVALEHRQLKIAAEGRVRFRFEVQVPPDTAPRECRFALLIEGHDPVLGRAQDMNFPVSGRLGVIVYVAIGGAQPQLEILGSDLLRVNGEMMPAVHVRNSGAAHGRLTGVLIGTDAHGKKVEFIPSTVPILPGATRAINLLIERESLGDHVLAYPLLIRGTLEYGDRRLPFEGRYAP